MAEANVGVGPLDLSDAELQTFEALPAAKYNCTVFSAEWQEASGQGKMPAGTPMLKVQFRIRDGEENSNRRFFTNYMLPGEGYDPAKAVKIKGIFVGFLDALGYDKKKVMSGKFNLDLEELVGKECVVTVSKEIDPYRTEQNGGETVWTNLVKGVAPAGAPAGAASGKLI